MEHVMRYGDLQLTFDAALKTESVTISREGREDVFAVRQISDMEWLLTADSKQYRIFAAVDRDGKRYIHSRGRTWLLEPVELEFGGDTSETADGRLTAAMPGKVIKVLVSVDQEVKKGDPVLILESMKMESTQEAPFDGRVVEVNAGEGQQVDAGTVIVRLEPTADEE